MRTWLRLTLVVLTVGGGFCGLMVLSDPRTLGIASGSPLVLDAIYAALAAFHLFVLISGLLLVCNPKWRWPVVIALAVQVPVFFSSSLTFQMADGAYAAIGLTDPGVIFLTYRVGTQCHLSYAQTTPWAIGTNVIPIILLGAIWWQTFRLGRNAQRNVAHYSQDPMRPERAS